jgi:hypothetical protein
MNNAGNLWLRIKHDDTDLMVRYNDVKESSLFKAICKLKSTINIEMRNKLKKELVNAVNTIVTLYPHTEYDTDIFEVLDKQPEGVPFDVYVSFKMVLLPEDYELDED